MPKAYLKSGREKRVEQGHPWIFRSDIDRVEKTAEPGDVVELHAAKGKFLGKAYYNPASMITLRMLTREDEPIDREFFYNRVQRAYDFRKAFCDINSCRLIYGESDFLPGLIVDKFADICVMQSLALGIDRYKDIIADAIMEITGCRGIYLRNDVPVRQLEGLELETGFLRGEFDTNILMEENGIKFMVDVANGQKTGFFLDQKENRAALAPICKDAKVLDCFCHNGSFSLHAAKFGAKNVLGVDISEEALVVARDNARRNGLDNVTFEAHNCFDHLRELTDAGEKFDVVILDPPAFTKSKNTVPSALRGYKEINLRGLKLVRPGGYLVTCSCSQHVSTEMFQQMINEAVRDSKKRVRMIEYRTQGFDHPILPASPETKYLKCMYLQVL